MKKLVVTDSEFPDLAYEKIAADSVGATFMKGSGTDAESLIEALTGADVALVQYAHIDKRALDVMGPAATVIRYGIGYDNVDVASASKLGISVANVPDYGVEEVADHTVAMLLALLRRVLDYDQSVRSGVWNVIPERPIRSFGETTIGFVGFGRIGNAVLDRLQPFGFKTIVFDPHIDKSRAESAGIRLVDLETLAKSADVVTLHAPLTDETRHIINASFLDRMKDSAALVNTSRGELVATEDLAAALRSGTIAAAALDVFESEPLGAEHPLRWAPNLILSPHAAYYSSGSLNRLQRLASEEAIRALKGEPLRCPVSA